MEETGTRRQRQTRRPKEVIRNLTRLVVRLEDAVAINNLDQDFVIFLQTEAAGNQWAITSALYQTAQE